MDLAISPDAPRTPWKGGSMLDSIMLVKLVLVVLLCLLALLRIVLVLLDIRKKRK